MATLLSEKAAQKKINELRKRLEKYDHLYYDLDRQEISDREYDKLLAECAALETDFPELVVPDSPTQRVGGKPLDKFEKNQAPTAHAFITK